MRTPFAVFAAFAVSAAPALAQRAPTRPVARPAAATAAAPLTTLDTTRLSGLRWRMIGPARGGRVTAVAGIATQPLVYYMGTVGGGVWKTSDAGHSWKNVTDAWLDVGSIGAIDVADSDPSVVYVGTGSAAIRSNVSIGHGMWKSSDAGKTWQFLGLRDAGQIGSVVVHPTDPSVVYVAALGNPFRPNAERGVFRTRDGGRSWQKVLFLSDSTGAADIELQPGNPGVVYATAWRGERKPWTIISGGGESGVYKSVDGGDTWKRLTNGLPAGVVGKSDLAVSRAMPNRLWVLMEAKPGGGLYRSDDAGESFVAVDTTTKGLITRPFYYDNVDADPTNADVLYVGTEDMYRSTDGGRKWTRMEVPHGDNHDLWINPADSRIMIQSNDGGANVTFDGGRSWSTQYNQPTAEIYQVYADEQVPYRVYGAQQDNTTVIVPSLPPAATPVDDPVQLWQSGPGCETGPIIPHPTRPDTVYGSCKGQFSRMSLRTGQEKQYWVGAQSLYGNANADLAYRFQRVSPMEVSRDGRTVWYGSQYVHRTTDEGVTWERISPDLTANPPERRNTISGEPITIDVTGEEMYSTLYAIRVSPLDPQVLWTGSNDGPFSLTRDGGRTWKNVTPPQQPAGCRVQNVEPSPHRASSAYYAVLCYLLGDFKPYLWKTDDWGATWRLLTSGTNGIAADEPTRVVREDPARAGLLYAGTEFGAYVSFDDGGRWWPLHLGRAGAVGTEGALPRTPVTDMKVHHGDLVISTQGRAFWILDDLEPLRQLGDAVASSPAHLFRPREALRLRYPTRFGGAEQDRDATADPQFLPPGAAIDYWLGDTTATVRLEIVDAAGRVVRRFSSDSGPAPADTATASAPPVKGESPATGAALRVPPLEAAGTQRLTSHPGLNRFAWDLAWPGPWDAAARRSGRNGPMALPGTYTVRLTAGAVTQSQPLVVRADPRVTADGVTLADLRAQLEHNLKVRDLVSEANVAVARLSAARKRFAGSGDAAALARLDSLDRLLVTPPVRYSRPGLQAHIQYLYGLTTNADQKVGRDAVERYAELRKQLDAALKELGERVAAR